MTITESRKGYEINICYTTAKKMTCQLTTDCLNEILENLENDKITLRSCLLVSRLWCKVSVKILWRNVWKF